LELSLEIQEGQGSDAKLTTIKKTIENWTLNKSYLMTVDIIPPNNTITHQTITTSYDATEGISQGFVYLRNPDKLFIEGRIDTKEDRITKMNLYASWLDVDYFDSNFCFFSYLVQHTNEWSIKLNPADKFVYLSTDFPPHYETLSHNGKRTLKLDPEKGFMPMSGESRWDATIVAGRTNWEHYSFHVNESKLTGDVWMPTEITQLFKTGTTLNNSTKMTMKITDMEHGKVTKKDITIQFPEGTSVADAIDGISYKTDANGEPIESTIEPLYGLDPSQVKLPEKKHSKGANYVLIVIGILLIVTAIFLMFWKRRKSP
jgi:LPXTG-motif cell wall-anchored protein